MMQYDSPLLSIVIPTKNRYETLLPVVRSILAFVKQEDVEIVIQDNSDNRRLADSFFRNQDNDSRVKYYYIEDPISIQENTNAAIGNANGKFIVFIGDDDLVSPYIYDIVKFINKKDIDCLIYNPAYYWWDTVEFKKENFFYKKKALWIPKNISLKLQKKDSKKELDFVLNRGGVSYFKLPRLYHGIVRRDILERVKEHAFSFVPGACPDIALSAAIALVNSTYFFINYPVTIFGASKNSGGGMSARDAHYGKIEDMKFLPSDILERWDKSMPEIWSAHTYYANSLIEVLNAFGIERRIDFEEFFGSMLAYEPNLKHYILPKLRSRYGNDFAKYLKVYKICIKKKLGIYYRGFKFKAAVAGYSVQLANNVEDCMHILASETKINIE